MTSGGASSRVDTPLADARYEVIPLAGAEEAVLDHVPTQVTVTVTTSPRMGLDPTLTFVERLAGHGYTVVPHLAARHVRDRGHLTEIVERLRAVGTNDVLVMAGDAEEPVGEFEGSLPLVQALAELGAPFRDVGITGYPESHAFVTDVAALRSTLAKEEHATYVVSQVCFDPDVTAAWVASMAERGSRLRVRIGLPGPVPLARLLRVCVRIGVGDSIELLRAEEGAAHTPDRDFDPDPLVQGLEQRLGGAPNVLGFHIFTFNQLAETERWRQRRLANAASAA